MAPGGVAAACLAACRRASPVLHIRIPFNRDLVAKRQGWIIGSVFYFCGSVALDNGRIQPLTAAANIKAIMIVNKIAATAMSITMAASFVSWCNEWRPLYSL
ncbi:MAG: hypothetical protein M5U34_34730 [Chloroflexi bacterium]|nr:hypothetical protein [Chloroflexota bacterium]